MSVEELKERGNERYQAKDYEEAIRLYSEAISLDSRRAVLYLNRAAVHLTVNRPSEALADAQMAALLEPRNVKAPLRVGKALYAMGKYQRALDEGFLPALALEPDAKTRAELEDLVSKAQAAVPKNEYGGKTFSYAHGNRHVWVEADEDKLKRMGVGI